MNDKYLKKQAQLHPAMRPLDMVKLCYQAAYGAEHLMPDPAFARAYLHGELEECAAAPDEALYEEISPELCRVNLRAWKAHGYPEENLLTLFMRACVPVQEGKAHLDKLLETVSALCAQGELPFDAAQWQLALADYRSTPPHAVHHSDAYRAAERPCYRLVRTADLLAWQSSIK